MKNLSIIILSFCLISFLHAKSWGQPYSWQSNLASVHDNTGYGWVGAASWNTFQQTSCFQFIAQSGSADITVNWANLGSQQGAPFGEFNAELISGQYYKPGTGTVKFNSQKSWYEQGACGWTIVQSGGKEWVYCPSLTTTSNHEMGHGWGHHELGANITKGIVMGGNYVPDPPIQSPGWPQKWERVPVISSDGAVGTLISTYGASCSNKPVAPEVSGSTPMEFALHAPHPNPFNPNTTLSFSLPFQSYVQLRIYNALGQQVRALEIGEKEVGKHNYSWDGRDDQGQIVASGVYIARLEVPERAFAATQQLTLMK